MKKLTQKQFLIITIVVIMAYTVGMAIKNLNIPSVQKGTGECAQYSTKNGYTGCNSIKTATGNKCKFKISNKINQATQKMEFQYACLNK
jgi:hypothetical protein